MKKSLLTLLIILFLPLTILSQVTFTDVAVTLGVNDPGAAQGVVFVDVNNDGFLDIFLVNNRNPNKLWINNNGTAFTEQSTAWGVNYSGPVRGISCADFNNDGFIDVMIGNYSYSNPDTTLLLYKNTSASFINFTTNAGLNFMAWGGSINWLDYNNDGKIDAVFANDGIPPHYNYLFRNDNLTSFTNAAYQVGLTDSNSTLCLASGDYDNDGDIDLFCGNQTLIPGPASNYLYRNNGDSTFTDVTQTSGLVTTFYSWGAEWGDYNNDGYLDLYVANYTGMNQLFRNNGNGTFTNVTLTLGLNDAGQSYSCGWADYDNDGDLDLYVAKGQNNADKMYRNDDTIFTDVASQAGMGDLRHSSCISWGDFNNDGFMDLYLNNNGTENRLYQNNAGNSNHWIIFKLIGVNTNRSAIGSRVTVVTGSLRQIREVEGGSGGKGQNSLPVEFGLGNASVIDSVIVRWQSGLVQNFTIINPDRIITLIEGQSIGIKNISAGIPNEFKLYQNYPNPFNPVTKIKYDVNKEIHVTLRVYNILGKEVVTLVNKLLQPGSYEAVFDGKNFAAGVYFYTLMAGYFRDTKKLVLIK
jgi:hypothetical protein